MATSSVSLKLLIDTKGKRVLFAEAGNEFVDFIFHILSLPVASVIRLLGKQSMVGSLSNLYESLENLNDSYIQQGHDKDSLLKPKVPNPIASVPLLRLRGNPTGGKTFYSCPNSTSAYNGNCRSYVTDDHTAKCPNCSHLMGSKMNYVAPATASVGSVDGGGFVKGVVTYMVMDDLMVKPVSTISSVTLLSKFNVQDLGSLQEKEVNVGMDEALKLLKASLHTNKVLTSVFISDV